jgi:hypothetical protein
MYHTGMKQMEEQYSDEEAERRMNEAMRRALNTPPLPRPTARRRKARKAGEDRPAPKRDGDGDA